MFKTILLLASFLFCVFFTHISNAQIVAGINVGGQLRGPLDTIRICQNSSITFNYAALNAINASWTFEGGNPANSNTTTNVVVTYNTVGTFIAKQVVQNGNLIDSTYTNIVVTNDRPTADFSFSPNNQCTNIPVNFTNLTTGAVRYIWSWGDGTPISTAANPTHVFNTPPLPGGPVTFNVTLIAFSAVGCVDSITRQVTVTRAPDARLANADPQVQLVNFNGVQTFRRCSNTPNYTFSFINASAPLADIVSYTINWGDGSPDSTFTSWATGAVVTHSYPLGNTTLTLSVTGSNGCIGIRRYNFFVGTNPTGQLGIQPNISGCAPLTIFFPITDVSTNSSGTLYTLTFNDGSPPQNFVHPPPDTVFHFFNQSSCGFTGGSFANSYSASLLIQNACGVLNPTQSPIQLSSRPRALISVTPDTNICINTPVTIAEIPLPGGGINSGGPNATCNTNSTFIWQIFPTTGWTINAGSLGSQNGQPNNSLLWTSGTQLLNLTFTQTGIYDVNLLVYNICGIDTIRRRICVRALPFADFTINNRVGCLPLTVVTNNLSTPTNPTCVGNAYAWSLIRTNPDNCSVGSSPNFIFTGGTDATSTNPSLQFSQPGIYIIRLSTRANSPFNICPISTRTDTIIVKSPPRVNINTIGSICVNNSITPTANVTNCYGTTPATYNWSFATGTPTGSVNLNPGSVVYNTISPTNPIVLTATNECGTGRDSINFAVTAAPTANAGPDRSVCSGTTTTIGVNTGSFTYTWTPSIGLSNPNVAVPTVNLTYNGANNDTTYQYIVNVSGGPTCNTRDTVLVTVRRSPTLNIFPTNPNLCRGDSVKIYVNGANTYVWSPTTGLNIFANDSAWASPSNTTTYSITGTLSSTNCSRTISTTVNVIPNARALFTPTQTIGCAPFTISNSILNLTTFPSQNSNYLWYVDNVLVANNTTGNFPNYTITNALDSVTIKLVVTSNNGCRPDSMSMRFYTEDRPVASFTKNVDTACGPVTVNFNNTSYNIPYFNHLWDFGNGQTSTLAQPGSITFNPSPLANDTTYNIRLRVFRNCDTSTFTRSVFVRSRPRANFLPNRTEGCSPMVVTFNNFSLGNSTGYQWNFGDGSPVVSGQTPITHTFYTPVRDTFFVQLTVSNQCGTDTMIRPIIVNPNNIFLDFRANALDRVGCAPHTVRFYNNSSGANTYTFNFGDGSPTVTRTSGIDTIIHTYNNPGTYIISMFGINTCTDTTSYDTVRVYATPVSNFTAQPTVACINDTIYFTNTGTINNVNFNWTFGDGTTSILQNPRKLYSAAGTYTPQLITSAVYPQGLVCRDTSQSTIIIRDTLPGSFTISPSNTGCAPLTVRVKNSVLGNPNTIWNFGNGTPNLNGDSVSFTYPIPGQYTITMISTTASGCNFRATQTINVNGAYGSLSFTPANICVGENINFSALSNNTAFYTFVFGDGDSIRTANNIVTHVYNKPGIFVPYIYFEDLTGCKVRRNYSDTIRVDSVNANFRITTQQNCGNTVVNYIDSSYGYFGLTAYSWQLANGGTANTQNAQQVILSTNTYNISHTVTGRYGCVRTITKPVNIVVRNRPIVSVSAPNNVCVGTSFNLFADVTSNDPISAFDWNFGNGVSANTQTVTVTYLSAGTYNIRLITTTIYNCADTQFIPITIVARPILNAGSDTRVCLGQSVQLQAFSNTNDLTWTPTSGLSCTNCSNPIASPLSSTNYIVRAVNSFGCSTLDTVLVSVVQPQTLTVSNDDTICIGQSVQLQASGTDVFLWSPASSLSSATVSNPTATPTTTTVYQVLGRDQYGCFTDTAQIRITVSNYPLVNVGPDTTLSTGTQYNIPITTTFGPFSSYLWTPNTDLSCFTCRNPVLTVSANRCYSVVATNIFGCSGRDTFCVKTICNGDQLFIPNAFSPDNDGVNDIFYVKSRGAFQIKSMRIFNRWGQLVFERTNVASNNQAVGWDGRLNGTLLPPDVFVYIIEAACSNGQLYTYKGDVTILK